MKKFITGVIIGTLLTSTIAFAASYIANPPTFKVMVNGEEFTSNPPTLVVEGSTYLPLKAIGDVLDVPVKWNEELRQVEVGNPPKENTSTNAKNITLGQSNALEKAKSYLDFTAFSYSGLVKQLEYEGFTNEEAVYAAENCGANWNEQAAAKAKSYLQYTSFSRSSLINQLEYEGFTNEQAIYGVESVGY